MPSEILEEVKKRLPFVKPPEKRKERALVDIRDRLDKDKKHLERLASHAEKKRQEAEEAMQCKFAARSETEDTMLNEKAEKEFQKDVNNVRKEHARLFRTMVQHRSSDVVLFSAQAITELRTDIDHLISTLETKQNKTTIFWVVSILKLEGHCE